MQMQQQELEGGVVKVTLEGSLDIVGAGEIDVPLSAIAGSRDKILVDLSRVDFLASIGVRVLVKAAKTIGNRGGKLVVVNPNDSVRKVLTSIGVDKIIPILDDEVAGVAALRSAAPPQGRGLL